MKRIEIVIYVKSAAKPVVDQALSEVVKKIAEGQLSGLGCLSTGPFELQVRDAHPDDSRLLEGQHG